MSMKGTISEGAFRFKLLIGSTVFGGLLGAVGFTYWLTGGADLDLPHLVHAVPILWSLDEFRGSILIGAILLPTLVFALMRRPSNRSPEQPRQANKPW